MIPSNDLEKNYRGIFDGRIGFGRSPAVIVVDFINAYVTEGSPFFAPGVVSAVRESAPLLKAARERKVPIVYTRVVVRPDAYDGGAWVRKVPAIRSLVEGNPMADIVPELPPATEDVIINKQFASAFFGTSLAPMLWSHGIDTLIIAGCSTSGCVRATAVDGIQHGFHVIVPRECVGDRHPGPHEANLFDINGKYGDVVSRDEVIQYFANLPSTAPRP